MSGLELSTVMGPGMGSTPGNDMLLPPRLETSSDKFKWRKAVSLWVTTVKRFAKGGDKRAKGILSALGLTLYNVLDHVFASQIEQAIAADLINLEGDDDESENTTKQLHLVQDIVNLVAKDSPTDGIRRLVQMMRQVFNCSRKNGEAPSLFARRFQALALDYLNHCDTATIQQDSQNFAMLLLENAKIPASVYSSIITRLVSTVTSRSEGNGAKIFVVSKKRLEDIRVRAQNILDASQNSDVSSQEKDSQGYNSSGIIEAVTATINANELHVKQDRTVFRITLDDAVDVLKDLKVEDDDKADHGVKHIGAMLGKREYNHQERQGNRNYSYRDKRHKTYIPNGQGPKSVSRCRTCNEPNHWYRDPECIYNVIKALIEGKEIPKEVVEKLSPSLRDMFKDENGNFQPKIPASKLIESLDGDKTNTETNPVSNDKLSRSYFR